MPWQRHGAIAFGGGAWGDWSPHTKKKKNMYCNVILFSRPLAALTYRLEVDVPVGAIVQVPIRQQSSTGIIVKKFDERPQSLGAHVSVRAIIEVVDPKPFITEPLMKMLEFMSTYYYAPLGYCLRLAIPAGMMRDGQCRYMADIEAIEGYLSSFSSCTQRPWLSVEEREKLRYEFEGYLRPVIDYARENSGGADGSESRGMSSGSGSNVLAMTSSEWVNKFRFSSSDMKNWISMGLFRSHWTLEKKRAVETIESIYSPTPSGREAVESGAKLGSKQRAILDYLVSEPEPVRHSAILAKFGSCQVVISRLEELAYIAKSAKPRDKTSFDNVEPIVSVVEPTDEQLEAIETIANHDRFGSFLLFGVTGSGKTEVYLKVMERIIGRGKGCIFVLPEIALTPQFCAVFKGRFGDSVAVLHSGLGETERFNTWTRIRDGRVSIAIGPRSALFAPIQNLGLIVIDEEHDGSFKQGELPYYHARDMALCLGKEAKCPVVLGSATPSFESYWRVLQNRSTMIKLTRRPLARPMPTIEIVDMRNRLPKGNSFGVQNSNRWSDRRSSSNYRSIDANDESQMNPDAEFDAIEDAEFESLRARILSPELESALCDTLLRGEQAIVFLNRRGYSTFIQCDYCGNSFLCPNCDVALTYYKHSNEVRCHYCDYQAPAPTKCSSCGRGDLSYTGFGTERVTALLSKVFPEARIDRLDRDRCSTKTLQSVLGSFREGKTDILVGTQMIAKGHDIPNVTLVGVICADTGLNMPDFRAAERTYQLLTQVSGRAGRGNRPGRVIIQTLRPDHPAIAGQVDRDFEAFIRTELQIRRSLQRPPYTYLILITFRSAQFFELERFVSSYAQIVEANNPHDGGAQRLGPALAPRSMVNGELRYQIFLQHVNRGVLHKWMGKVVRQSEEMCKKAESFIHISIDVDPYDML